MNLALVVPIVVAVAGIVGAYLVAARQFSGKIETSDAAQLWEESKSIREDYRQRLDTAADRQLDLEGRVAKLEGQNTLLIQENFELKHKVEELEKIVGSQAETITKLETIITDQRERLEEGK